MKKALIALSVAAGMIAAAQAENTTTLYGAISAGTEIAKSGSLKTSVSKNKWDLNNGVLRFGIKGTEDLNNGLQAFYRMEYGFDTDSNATVI